MAHPSESTEAVGAPVDRDSVAAALADSLDAEDGIGNETEETDEAESDELDAADLETEETDEQDDEPETAIDAPASLNAEEKARYKQLPTEAQQFVSELETRRNAQVQQATTKAADAQRIAEERAATANAEAKKVYAGQLMEVIRGFAPAEPSAELARTDPAEYIAQKAQYDADVAQLNQFAQQVVALDKEASTEIDQTFVQSRDRALMAIPEVQNEATRAEFFTKATEAAKALNLDTPALNTATADEWQKLRIISDWKAGYDKYQAALSNKMKLVRAGKPKAMKPGSAQPAGSANGAALVKQFREKPNRDTAAAMLAATL